MWRRPSPHIELLSYCTAPLKLKNEVCMSMSSSGAVPVSVLPVSRSVRHLLSKRPPQVIAKVRKEEFGRWSDNIFREAHSQLVTSWIRVLPSLFSRSSRSATNSNFQPCTRTVQPILSGWNSFIRSEFRQTKAEPDFPNAVLTPY